MTQKQKPKRRRVVFTLDAPGAENVHLAGDFNAWDRLKHPMKKNEKGVWQKAVMLIPGRYEYRFLVDGQWVNDWLNTEICPNYYGTVNNVITVSAKG